MKLLLAEDDRIVRITVRDALQEQGYLVTDCSDGTGALQALERDAYDVILSDVRLPGMDGIALFRRARQVQPGAAVVLMTAYADTADAVAVMREGARDYLLKPFDMQELLLRLARVRDEVLFRRRMEEGGASAEAGEPIRGTSAPVRRLIERVEAAAASDVGVLITGETGTGKDLCARSIHARSRRGARPFVVVNCAAIPENLLESELFGHEKGAFTGADRRRSGRFEAAHGGTLFLDEVGELSVGSQAKLLRAIETATFEPVGSNRSLRVDARIIAATNRDLASSMGRGQFRKDLFYRLNVIDVRLPPLRERRSDIPILAGEFLAQIAAREGRASPALDPRAAAVLATHDFPGNVRELLHALERAVALSRGGTIRPEHLPEEMVADAIGRSPAACPGTPTIQPLGTATEQFERQYVQRALKKVGGHRGRAAALLGISRKSLWQRLREVTGDPSGGGEGGTS